MSSLRRRTTWLCIWMTLWGLLSTTIVSLEYSNFNLTAISFTSCTSSSIYIAYSSLYLLFASSLEELLASFLYNAISLSMDCISNESLFLLFSTDLIRLSALSTTSSGFIYFYRYFLPIKMPTLYRVSAT